MNERRGRGDRGSVSVFVVVMVPALLAAAGLVLDGGRQLQARRDAQGAAQAAARAALQPSEDEALHDEIDADQAIGRAHAELARHGASGSATLDGDTLVVTVVADVDYLILPGGASVSESADAVLQEGIDDGQ
jgi:Flp pilus assembly protein TadG